MMVPNLPTSPITNQDGTLSDVGKDFFNALISGLQANFSNEGLVAPPQNASNITTIQNNQLENSQYTCQYGTILYDSTNNSGRFAINNGSGAPIFKTITLT
jgi:hypothetical protein